MIKHMWLLVILFTINNVSHGQSLPLFNQEKDFAVNNFTPFAISGLSNLISSASLSTALNAGENAKLELKYNSKKFFTLGLSADQKLNEGTKEGTPLDIFDGLSDGTTIRMNIQKFFWNPSISEKNTEKFIKAATLFAKRTGKDPRMVTLQDVQNGGIEEEKQLVETIKIKDPWLFNFEAGFTKENFSFATDMVSFEKKQETHYSPVVSGILGRAISPTSVISLGYNYSEEYEEADELSLFVPVSGSLNGTIKTLPFGKPVKSKESKLTLEWRNKFTNLYGFSLGIAPSLSFAFDADKLGLILPLYFINSKNNEGKPSGLQGGVRFGYVTSSRDIASFKRGFAAQFIITAPFDIFGSF